MNNIEGFEKEFVNKFPSDIALKAWHFIKDKNIKVEFFRKRLISSDDQLSYSAFFEMIMHYKLIRDGMFLVENNRDSWPDIILSQNGLNFYIECVRSQAKGLNHDEVNGIKLYDSNSNNYILRYTNSIHEKIKHAKQKIHEDRLIIAIDVSDCEDVLYFGFNNNNLAKTLYGHKELQIPYSINEGKVKFGLPYIQVDSVVQKLSNIKNNIIEVDLPLFKKFPYLI